MRAALVATVALAAALRLPNLASNPGWDGDEGYNYNIAFNLAHGRHMMFALDFAFVQHPPLFFVLAAGLFRVLGPGMLALRLLSIAFSLGTLALLVPLGRAVADDEAGAGTRGARGAGDRIGLLAALAYAVVPFIALQNRFGYTYNGLAFWTTLALLAVLRARRGAAGWLVVAGLAGLAGAAALTTDQEAVYLLPFLLLGPAGIAFWRRAGALLLALAGPALYLGAMAWSDRATLFFDVTHTAGRMAGGSITLQIAHWLYNLADLMRIDPSIPLGLAGLALIPRRAGRWRVMGLLALMLLVILKVRDPNPLFRTAEPLLPLVCLGLGLLGAHLWVGIEATMRRFCSPGRARLVGAALALLLLAPATGLAVRDDAVAAGSGFHTPIDGLLPRSTIQAGALATWLNARLRPHDVVLVMPQISWLLHARTAEVLQAVAITGQGSAFYPAGIAARRWAYDVHLSAARYLVVDAFTRAWIAQSPAERAVVRQAQASWRLVYMRGEYQVYENPLKGSYSRQPAMRRPSRGKVRAVTGPWASHLPGTKRARRPRSQVQPARRVTNHESQRGSA